MQYRHIPYIFIIVPAMKQIIIERQDKKKITREKMATKALSLKTAVKK